MSKKLAFGAVVAIALAAALIALATLPPRLATAEHVAGATYADRDIPGISASIIINVSSDGRAIEELTFSILEDERYCNLLGAFPEIHWHEDTFRDVQIHADHSFVATEDSGWWKGTRVSGTFSSPQAAEGTIHWRYDPTNEPFFWQDMWCEVSVGFRATLESTPTPSPAPTGTAIAATPRTLNPTFVPRVTAVPHATSTPTPPSTPAPTPTLPPTPTPAPTPTPTPGPGGTVNLVSGWSPVPYSGSTRRVEQALGNCQGVTEGVFFWNTSTQVYTWWFRTAPAGVNNLVDLAPGRVYWVRATAPCNWQQS